MSSFSLEEMSMPLARASCLRPLWRVMLLHRRQRIFTLMTRPISQPHRCPWSLPWRPFKSLQSRQTYRWETVDTSLRADLLTFLIGVQPCMCVDGPSEETRYCDASVLLLWNASPPNQTPRGCWRYAQRCSMRNTPHLNQTARDHGGMVPMWKAARGRIIRAIL
jgi:hypothetical protein